MQLTCHKIIGLALGVGVIALNESWGQGLPAPLQDGRYSGESIARFQTVPGTSIPGLAGGTLRLSPSGRVIFRVTSSFTITPGSFGFADRLVIRGRRAKMRTQSNAEGFQGSVLLRGRGKIRDRRMNYRVTSADGQYLSYGSIRQRGRTLVRQEVRRNGFTGATLTYQIRRIR